MGMDLGARAPYSPPAFPAEPAAGGRPWIKWAVIAVLLIAVGAGVLLAQKMGSFAHPANMASPAPGGPAGAAATDKDGISQEDKARADALVGPQNRDTAAPAVPDAAAPASGDTAVGAPPATQLPPPQAEPSPRPDAAATAAVAAQQPATALPNRPAVQNKPGARPQNRSQPTLDDLLD